MFDWNELETKLLDYWFGSIDDATPLMDDPSMVHVRRWCSKGPAIDADIRQHFESYYQAVTSSAQVWRDVAARVRDSPRGSLALTILLDQIPRNIYRGTARMYAHDGLALALAFRALDAGHADAMSLPEKMFQALPLMHAEDLTLQWIVEEWFEGLARASKEHSPDNVGYYENALASARRHRSVIERFGRFPHRNEILGRDSTPRELTALRDEEIHF